MFYFIHVYKAPGARGDNPWGKFVWCKQKGLITLITGKKLCPLILCTFLVILSIYIALGQGQTTHYGQNFDVNRKASSLWSFVASSKRISSIFDLIHIFHDLINVYSRMSGVDNPRGQNFDVNRNLLSLWSFATSFKKISLKVDIIQLFSWFFICL